MSKGLTPGVPGAPEPRMYPHSGYFLVFSKVTKFKVVTILTLKQDPIIFFATNSFVFFKEINPCHNVMKTSCYNN